MKFLISASIAMAFGFSAVAFAAQTTAAMEDCFRAHAQLMSKPAVKNVRDCWRTHGYKMSQS